jgi:phosphoesterase RecJ-like protein
MNLRSLLSGVRSIIVMGHQNADPDAVCAMVAFKALVRRIDETIDIELVADDVSRLACQVLSTFAPEEVLLEETASQYDLYVLLDTNSRFQLGEGLQSVPGPPEKTIVIDHHEPNPEIGELSSHSLVRSDRFSTCEIVADLYRDLGLDIAPRELNLILTGILFDTRRFFYSDKETLQTTLRLIADGADYDKCVHSLIIKPDRSERIARLTAAGRLKIHTIGPWVVVTSKVRAFEASACRGLLDIGADVAIVGGRPDKSQVRLSSRSTREFSNSTGVNLGTDLMEPLGTVIGGKGGGHANAAGANGKERLEEALAKAVDLIRDAVERGQRESTNSA